jgi:hypothetical protein
MMNAEPKARWALRRLLQIGGGVSLLATLAIVMPRSWMAVTHRWLGLGEFPQGMILDYLTRSASALYAMFGGMLLILARDVVRYAGIIRYWGAAMMLFGVVLIGIDVAAGMPAFWTWMEGPWLIVFGGLILALQRVGN